MHDEFFHGITVRVLAFLVAIALLLIVGAIAAALPFAIEHATEIREYW